MQKGTYGRPLAPRLRWPPFRRGHRRRFGDPVLFRLRDGIGALLMPVFARVLSQLAGSASGASLAGWGSALGGAAWIGTVALRAPDQLVSCSAGHQWLTARSAGRRDRRRCPKGEPMAGGPRGRARSAQGARRWPSEQSERRLGSAFGASASERYANGRGLAAPPSQQSYSPTSFTAKLMFV